jgi:hypothetical protein
MQAEPIFTFLMRARSTGQDAAPEVLRDTDVPRPAINIDGVKIDLPRPRQASMTEQVSTTEDERFNQYVRRPRKSIEASHAR